MNQDWPFEDPKNVMVITTKQIINERKPILFVFRDLEEGMWQFHDGSDVSIDDAMVVALASVVKIDSSIKMLADLPPGWCAWRSSTNNSWTKKKYEE